jgi:hypothetical protein
MFNHTSTFLQIFFFSHRPNRLLYQFCLLSSKPSLIPTMPRTPKRESVNPSGRSRSRRTAITSSGKTPQRSPAIDPCERPTGRPATNRLGQRPDRRPTINPPTQTGQTPKDESKNNDVSVSTSAPTCVFTQFTTSSYDYLVDVEDTRAMMNNLLEAMRKATLLFLKNYSRRQDDWDERLPVDELLKRVDLLRKEKVIEFVFEGTDGITRRREDAVKVLHNAFLFRDHSIHGNANWEYSHRRDISNLMAAVRYLELIGQDAAADDAAKQLDRCMARIDSRFDLRPSPAKTDHKCRQQCHFSFGW